MSDVIRINPDALAAQTGRLKSIADNRELQSFYDSKISRALLQSSGGSADLLDQIGVELSGSAGRCYEVVNRTEALLTNTGTTFIEGDKSLSEQIRDRRAGA